MMDLPEGCTSGQQLSITSTWDGQTFSTLGLNPGTYVYTWGSGPTADSLTVDVVSPQAVPEPTTLWVALIGGVAILRAAMIDPTGRAKLLLSLSSGRLALPVGMSTQGPRRV